MTAIAPTAGTPRPSVPRDPSTGGVLPPTTIGGAGTGPGLRLRITGWMEAKLGKAAMPVAALAGGALGGALGMLTLGPVGALAGGAAGAFFGAALFMSG